MNTWVINGLIRRYLYTMRHDLNRAADTFYEPAMQIFIWGLTSTYIKNSGQNLPHIVLMILSGVVFWTVISHAQYAISINLLQEFWDRNLVNIFAAPIKIREWIVSVMIVGIIKMSFSLIFAILLVLFVYHTNLFQYGFLFIPFIVNLAMTGWIVGFVTSSFIIRFGQTIQALAWIGFSLLAPFSAVYYPVTTLPSWAQNVAGLVPTSYVFEGMREILFTGRISYDKLLISFLLNLIYLALSILFFIFMFNRSRKLGLGRLI